MSVWTATGYINVARITKAHGKYGEVVAVPVDNLPFCLRPGMQVYLTPPSLKMPRCFTVKSANPDTCFIAFEEVASLNDAEVLAGKTVLAKREDVPEFVEEQEYFDCVGHKLTDDVYGEIGIIKELMFLPGNDVWRVDGGRYGEVLVPVIEEVLLELPSDGSDEVLVHLMPGILPELPHDSIN